MKAIDRAAKAWKDAGSPRSFWGDVQEHLIYGYVVAMPRLFAMCRPVECWRPERELAEITRTFEHPDCWLIWSAAGDLAGLLGLLPFELPFLAFHRGGARRRGPQPLRIYRTERVRALALGREAA